MGERRDKKSGLWERDALDWYVEPPRATTALLSVEKFSGGILDPCCGRGNIVKALIEAGYSAKGSDLVDRSEAADWFSGPFDFMKWDGVGPANICFNPPFFRAAGAEKFIRKAIGIATSKVAVFVDIRFLAGAKRANGLFRDRPPNRIWVVTPRVSCPPGAYLAAGHVAGNGSSDWCWLVYDLTAPPPTMSSFGWLRSEK